MNKLNKKEFVSYCLNTYSGRILALNCLIFILMFIDDKSFFSPNQATLIKWGALDPVSLAQGEWWRLLTAIFIHFGIIHLAFNTFALYIVGRYVEKMIGKYLFIIVYFFSGVCSFICSSILSASATVLIETNW